MFKKKKKLHTPTHRCVLVSKQVNIYRKGSKPQQTISQTFTPILPK